MLYLKHLKVLNFGQQTCKVFSNHVAGGVVDPQHLRNPDGCGEPCHRVSLILTYCIDGMTLLAAATKVRGVAASVLLINTLLQIIDIIAFIHAIITLL